MKRILITGSTGFIGRHLAEYIKKYGSTKYLLDTPTHEELDLVEKEKVRRWLQKRNVDCVIHCACPNNVRNSIDNYEMLDMSLRMFDTLAEVSDVYEKMIYFGSGAEYNRHYGKHLVLEDDLGTCLPLDAYGFAKYIEAKLANKYQNIYELCLFGVYGKYEEWQRRFISSNIVRLLKGLPMTMSQNAMFDYMYVDDLCRIVEWFIEHEPKHHRYNVCTSQPVALLDLAYMINEVSGLNRELQIAHSGWQTEYSGNNERLLNEIGEFQFTDKKKSIKEMWDYYSEHIAEFDEQKLLV